MRYRINFSWERNYQVVDSEDSKILFATTNRAAAIARVQQLNDLVPADGVMNTYANQVATANRRSK